MGGEMKIQIFTFLGIVYVLLQVWFFNISSLGWRLNASWVIITTILFTLIIIYANATINFYKGGKKMSKSIYEEALEKINIEFDAWERSEKIEVIEIIEEALEQAQKQEKLLKLYQKYNHDYNDLTLDEEIDIIKQIKELENE